MFTSAFLRSVWVWLATSCIVLLFACGGGGGGGGGAAPPPTADFSIQLSPASLSIPAGGSGFVTVTLSRLNGFSSSVTLSGAGFPSGVVANGSLASGVSSIQLPIAIAPGVATSNYSGLSIRGQAGTLSHDAAIGLTVTAALAPSHLRDDLVQAAGGRQAGGTLENHAVVREAVPAKQVRDAGNTTEVRHAFLPSGTPIKQ